MKIVNIKRFRMFVIGVVIMVLLFISLLNIKTLSNTQVDYINFTIGSNDTLWEISKLVKENNVNYNNKDIREIVFEIKQINNLENSNIYDKQVIKVPEI